MRLPSLSTSGLSLEKMTPHRVCDTQPREIRGSVGRLCPSSPSPSASLVPMGQSLLVKRQKHLSASKHGRETPHTVVTDECAGDQCAARSLTDLCRKEADHLGTAAPAEGAALIGSRRDECGARL